MARFHVHNLGCKVNRVEASGIAKELTEMGHEEVPLEDAQAVIVNTCTVTEEADSKSRKAVRQALRRNPTCKVLVTGCAATISAESFLELGDRVMVLGKDSILDEIGSLGSSRRAQDSKVVGFVDDHERIGVKIQDGCDRNCSYCIVCKARGRSISLPLDDVLGEVANLAEQGIREIMLTGINLGAYRFEGQTLSGLLMQAIKSIDSSFRTSNINREHPPRLRISSIEPTEIDEELIGTMTLAKDRICWHLHIPLQSGSSKVLKEMRRPYDIEGYMDTISSLKRKMPSISITTDMIVGFPGETDLDFEMSLRAAREIGFSKIHVFPYSRRQGTDAAKRPDQIKPELKRERADALRRLSEQLRSHDLERRRGSDELCLVQSNGIMITDSYHELPYDNEGDVGKLIMHRI